MYPKAARTLVMQQDHHNACKEIAGLMLKIQLLDTQRIAVALTLNGHVDRPDTAACVATKRHDISNRKQIGSAIKRRQIRIPRTQTHRQLSESFCDGQNESMPVSQRNRADMLDGVDNRHGSRRRKLVFHR